MRWDNFWMAFEPFRIQLSWIDGIKSKVFFDDVIRLFKIYDYRFANKLIKKEGF